MTPTHAHDLRRFAVYLSGNTALADDLVSEAFVRAWTTRDRIALSVTFNRSGFQGLLIDNWAERIVVLVVAAALWATYARLRWRSAGR